MHQADADLEQMAVPVWQPGEDSRWWRVERDLSKPPEHAVVDPTARPGEKSVAPDGHEQTGYAVQLVFLVDFFDLSAQLVHWLGKN
jgi:hypothetical protein